MNHPKISFLIDNLKIFTKNKFDELIESLVTNKYKKYEYFNIYNDIYNFIKNIKEKNRIPLSLDLLNNMNDNEKLKLKEIGLNIIKDIFNYELKDDNYNEKENDLYSLIGKVQLEEDDNEGIKQLEEPNDSNNNINLNNLYNYEGNYDITIDVYKKPLKKDRNSKYELTDFNILNDELYFKKSMIRSKK